MPFLLKDSSWYFNNSLLCQPNFSSAAKKLHSILKTQENNHSSAKDRWKYTKSCFKENARNSKFNHSRKYQNFKTEKEVTKPIRKINPNQKLNQLSKICKMNFTNQKTNKQKVLPKTSRSNTFFKVLERKNMQNQTRSEFILMIINQNILASLLAFSNLKKNFYEKFYTKEVTFKTATTEFLSQIPNRKNISNEQFHLCEAKILQMTLQNL